GISLAYLGSILATLLMQPLASAPAGAIGFLKTSNLWLAPLQGLATAALGAFFVKLQPPKRPAEGAE
ncbi:MAG: hypothetical protein JWN04_3021, partial [Myxococcaceae bacterium]|nr:hypothetical protein [Myxococcaceae bacterium]